MSVSAARRIVATFQPVSSVTAVRRIQSPNLPGSTLSSVRRITASPIPSSSLSSVRRIAAPASVESGGVWGERQHRRRSISADRIKTNDISQLEIGEAAVGTSELIDGNVTPAKLDRAYQEALGSLEVSAGVFRTIPGTGAPTLSVINDDDVAALPAASTTGLRARRLIVPQNYDPSKDILLFLLASGSGSNANPFRVLIDTRKNGGGRNGTLEGFFTPSGVANEQSLQQIATYSAGTFGPGDSILFLLFREGPEDVNPDDLQITDLVVRFGA